MPNLLYSMYVHEHDMNIFFKFFPRRAGFPAGVHRKCSPGGGGGISGVTLPFMLNSLSCYRALSEIQGVYKL